MTAPVEKPTDRDTLAVVDTPYVDWKVPAVARALMGPTVSRG